MKTLNDTITQYEPWTEEGHAMRQAMLGDDSHLKRIKDRKEAEKTKAKEALQKALDACKRPTIGDGGVSAFTVDGFALYDRIKGIADSL